MDILVGEHVLVVGNAAGTAIRRAGEPGGDVAELERALDAPPSRADQALVPLETLTDRVEKGTELAQQLADGLSPADLEAWIEPALALIERLDRAGRSQEALELVRVAQRVLALARRWWELIQLLRGVLDRAREAGDEAVVAWAQHELGTLNLAVCRLREADERLTEAIAVRHTLGDRAGMAVTEQSLRVLCGHLREALREDPPGPRPRRSVRIALALLLLLIGLVAGTALGQDDTSTADGDSDTPTPTRTATPTPTPSPSATRPPRRTETPAPDHTRTAPPAVTEEPPPVVTEEPPPVVTEEPPPVVTEEPPPVVSEEPPPVVTEEPPPDVTVSPIG